MPSLTPRTLVRRRVRNSAKLLDERLPTWPHLIDLGTLDMTRMDCCVLGQLEAQDFDATWEQMLDRLGLTELQACQRGFNLGDEKTATDEVSYDDLEEFWRAEIVKRRTAS